MADDMGILGRLMMTLGLADEPQQDPGRSWAMTPPVTPWPTPMAVQEERAYGTPGPTAGSFAPIVTPKEAISLFKQDKLFDVKPNRPMPAGEADRLYAAKMAAGGSNIATLGFDPNRIISSPADGTALTMAGMYSPGKDFMWSSGQSATNPVHESLHRGLKMLRDEGTGIGPLDEETLVRALMLRNYGPVEHQPGSDDGNEQVARAQAALSDSRGSPHLISTIQQLEKAAAHRIAGRNLNGSPDTGYDRR